MLFTVTFLNLHSFDTLASHLRSPAVIKVCKAFVRRLQCISGGGSSANQQKKCLSTTTTTTFPQKKTQSTLPLNVSVVLSAYLIAFHDDRVFDAPFLACEHRLIDLATRLVGQLERIAQGVLIVPGSCSSSSSFGCLRGELAAVDFHALLCNFIERFQEWRAYDQVRLSQRLQCSLAGVEDAIEIIRAEDPGNTSDLPSHEVQLARLRGRLAKIAGQDTLDRYDATRRVEPLQQRRRLGLIPGGCSPLCSGRMSNEELAHELLLNPAFQLLPESGGVVLGVTTLDEAVRWKLKEVICVCVWVVLATAFSLFFYPLL